MRVVEDTEGMVNKYVAGTNSYVAGTNSYVAGTNSYVAGTNSYVAGVPTMRLVPTARHQQ